MKRSKFTIGGMVVILLTSLLALGLTIAAGARTTPETTPPVLDAETLAAKALAMARAHGLQGQPTAQKGVLMTLAEWESLVGIERDVTPPTPAPADPPVPPALAAIPYEPVEYPADSPVYVAVYSADVVWSGAGGGSPRPSEKAPQRYDNLTIVLDACTGDSLWALSRNPGVPLPVPVP